MNSSSRSGVNSANIAVDKLPRGWLNWLSRGMLGAGGTDDSSQFSGVVSDEVIKVSVFCLLIGGIIIIFWSSINTFFWMIVFITNFYYRIFMRQQCSIPRFQPMGIMPQMMKSIYLQSS